MQWKAAKMIKGVEKLPLQTDNQKSLGLFMILFLPQDEWAMVQVYEIMEAVCRENTELLFPKSCGIL